MKQLPAQRKSKTAKPPWIEAYWEGEFLPLLSFQEYTPRQAMGILETIPRRELRQPGTVEDLKNVMRTALEFAHFLRPKPKNKEVTRQLTLLFRQSNKLLSTLASLHGPTLNALEYGTDAFLPELQLKLSHLRMLADQAKTRRLSSKEAKGGHPRNLAMRHLTWQLIYWWDAHIGAPDCSRDAIHGVYQGAFYHFAVSVLTPILGDRGLDAIIERVVSEWRRTIQQAKQR